MQLNDPTLFKQACLINGAWVTSPTTTTIYNPADNSIVGTVPNLGSKETADAITAAEKAWPMWKALTPLERGTILRRWQELVIEHIEDLAVILTTEQGKPLAEAKGEIANGANYIGWFAEEGRRVYGTVIPSPWAGKQPITIKQPIGVTAAITPWNFPMSMIPRKAAPALAAGCPMIIKPASQTPFSALALAELGVRAGIPQGVLSVITGSASAIGLEICSNPIIRKLSFTGSTAVGKKLIADCASSVKKVSMELGGNAPMIVCPDANLDQAVAGAMSCKFRNSGQTCICVNRLIVHESIYTSFAEKLAQQVQKIVLGNGLNTGVTQGPLINTTAHASMQEFVTDAVSKGAKIVCGGKPSPKGALFYEPTILTHVTKNMRVFQEEIFGPLAPLISYSTEAEAITLANDTEYGLASYVYTRDMGSFYRIATGLEYGMVGVNETSLASGEVPFGGVKSSGLGREGGREGIEDYVETKYILLGGLDE